MKLNLDLSKIEDFYIRHILRQILDAIGSIPFYKSITDHFLSSAIYGEVLETTAGTGRLPPLRHTPRKNSVIVYKDGLRAEKRAYNVDYNTGVITFIAIFLGGEVVQVDYVK